MSDELERRIGEVAETLRIQLRADDRRAVYDAVLTSEKAGAKSFQLEWYKLHRAHEVELNKATLQYEHERLKFLAYLNGGAAAAFLALLKSWEDAQGAGCLAYFAAMTWVGGLLTAWFAWSDAYEGQRGYTEAYRNRRMATERELDRRAENAEMLTPQLRYGTEEDSVELANGATALRDTAALSMKQAWSFATTSAVLFAVGSFLAVLGIGLSARSASKATSAQVMLQINDEVDGLCRLVPVGRSIVQPSHGAEK